MRRPRGSFWCLPIAPAALGCLLALAAVSAPGPRAAVGEDPARPAPALVGTWTLDRERLLESTVEAALKQGRENLDKLQQRFADADAKADAAPEAEREAIRSKLREQVLAAAGRHRDVAQALLTSRAEAEALLAKRAREESSSRLQGFSALLRFQPDGTYAGRSVREGEAHVDTGVWALAGDTLTMTRKARNGIAKKPRVETSTLRIDGDSATITPAKGGSSQPWKRTGETLDERPDPSVVDPTGLLTADEVGRAAGVAVGPPDCSGAGQYCDFHTAGEPRLYVAQVAVERRRLDAAQRFATRTSMYKVAVPGLGDGAFVNDGRVFARKGEIEFKVTVSKEGAKGDVDEVAKTLARIVVDRLPGGSAPAPAPGTAPATAPEPTPSPAPAPTPAPAAGPPPLRWDTSRLAAAGLTLVRSTFAERTNEQVLLLDATQDQPYMTSFAAVFLDADGVKIYESTGLAEPSRVKKGERMRVTVPFPPQGVRERVVEVTFSRRD